jgi:Rrf2 family protein
MSLSLSTRGRYGVRFMAALAAEWGRGSTLLRDISRREAISEKYLGQIVIPLKASGLVSAQRGARGGYSLAHPPAEITVLEVVEAIEGPVAPVPCTEPGCGGAEAACDRGSECAASEVWKRLREDIRASLASVTLAALAARARELAPPVVATYSI